MKKIEELLGKENLKFLIIDDSVYAQKLIKKRIMKQFSTSQIFVLESFANWAFEKILQENQFDSIFLDGSLDDWLPHDRFGKEGKNLIPYIKINNPDALIIAASSSEEVNVRMVEEGADFAIEKNVLMEDGLVT